MRLGVDADALAVGGAAVDRAAALMASVRVDELATSIAAAMPGSRSAGVMAQLVAVYGATTAAMARDLTGHADALRAGSVGYAKTEGDVAAAERHERGAA